MNAAHRSRPTVRCTPGLVELFGREAFATFDSRRWNEFLARVARASAVTAVTIDPRRERLSIAHGEPQGEAHMLRNLAAALLAPENDDVSPHRATVRDVQTLDVPLFVAGDAPGSGWEVFREERIVINLYHAPQTQIPPEVRPEVEAPYAPAADLDAAPPVGGPVRRVAFLLLAGGSFGMSIVGVAVPGIPTVPFLLLTSYFLVRSSPRLNERLLSSRTVGPMLRDWQRERAMSPGTKRGLLGFLVVTVGLTLLLAEPPVWLTAIIFGVSALSVYYVLRIPTVRAAVRPAAEMSSWPTACFP